MWWTGAERTEIVREMRHARGGALRASRKTALAPQSIADGHDAATDLGAPAIEAIHRIVSDPGRLSESWYQKTTSSGFGDEAHVELLSVVAIATAIDTFDRSLGVSLRPLPPARRDAPSRRRPAGARPGLGWMPMLAPEDVAADDPPLYTSAGRSGGNVHRALSLVPEAMIQFWDLFETMYLPQEAMRDFEREHRRVTHAQIEMLAARVAVRNRCLY